MLVLDDEVQLPSRVRVRSHLHRGGFELATRSNKNNSLAGGEGWILVLFPPPLAIAIIHILTDCAVLPIREPIIQKTLGALGGLPIRRRSDFCFFNDFVEISELRPCLEVA
jgi:hypothetical protein